jgi:nicotinamidase/pyrazinamidase
VRALILVDLQYDFMPGGALAVPEGDLVVPVANRLQERFDFVVASQDWHPSDHRSFAANNPGREIGDVVDLDGIGQVMWPVHCVQESRGARLVESLDQSRICRVFQKGTNTAIDSYSTFFDNGYRQSTGLTDYLRSNGIDEVFLAGLATDYCVKFSALDASRSGFRTTLVQDGCRGVELEPGDVGRALDEMRRAGVQLLTSREVLAG